MEPDESVRVRQSANTNTSPEVLRDLAHDSSVTVRATLALNPAAPAQANVILAADQDERVRALLGQKLAALMPNLSDAAYATVRQQTIETLTALVADEAVRVRQSIAKAVKHMPDAPREIILRLAHDPEIMVAEPVILFSPLLTSQDLVALIVAAPSAATVTTVAQRSGIDGAVAAAIVAAAQTEAIAALLSNPSAQIMEATLDALVQRAETEVSLQPPLVRRPSLPARAARALSLIVTDHLLEVLSARPDLDPALTRELRDRLRDELPETQPGHAASWLEPGAPGPPGSQDALKLTDEAFIAAARKGDTSILTRMLAARAGVPLSVVERACAIGSAKGLVALAWKANLPMQIAQVLQVVLGRMPPDSILHARPGGGFPMTVQEMRWKLEFLYRTPRAAEGDPGPAGAGPPAASFQGAVSKMN